MLILFVLIFFQLEQFECSATMEEAILASRPSAVTTMPCFAYPQADDRPDEHFGELYSSFTDSIKTDVVQTCSNFYNYACHNFDNRHAGANTPYKYTLLVQELVDRQKRALVMDEVTLTDAGTSGSLQKMVQFRDLCMRDTGRNADTCFKAIDEVFRLVVDHLYLLKYWVPRPDTEKEYIKKMIENIYESLGEMVKANKYWLELDKSEFTHGKPIKTWAGIDPVSERDAVDTTYEHAQRKYTRMRRFIGTFPEMLNCKVIDVLLADLSITPGSSYMDALNRLRGQKRASRMPQLNNLRLSNDCSKMISPTARVTGVNAQYEPDINSVFIRASMLQRPFFDMRYPDAVNYGRIGQTVGHEFTHAFDSTGAKQDVNGERKQWMGALAFKEFERRDFEVRKSYENNVYALPHHMEHGISIKTEYSAPENIADQGGVQIAYHAFTHLEDRRDIPIPLHKDYKIHHDDPETEQKRLLFTSYATMWCDARSHASREPELTQYLNEGKKHSPGYARVNVVLGNNEDFTETFNCYHSGHERMVPAKQVTVWTYKQIAIPGVSR